MDYLFLAYFSDASSFRALIDFLKSTVKNGNFIFNKKKITFCRSNDCNTLLLDLIIDTDMIGQYEYNNVSEKTKEPSETKKNQKKIENDVEESVTLGIELEKLRIFTNPIGTKDSFKIWKLKKDVNLYMQKISTKKNLSSNTVDFITPNVLELEKFNFTKDIYNENHNCTILAQEFSEMCKIMVSMKSTHVIAIGYPKGIVFEACSGSSLIGKRVRYGNFGINVTDLYDINKQSNNSGETTDQELIRIKIKINIIKSLGRINNFVASSKGIIRIFMSKNQPIYIKTKVGNYGDLSIYLRDEKTNVQILNDDKYT